MVFRSLKLRLALALSASLLVLLGAQYWVVSGAIRATAEDYVASRLRHDTESLLAALRWGADGPRLAGPADNIYRRPYSGHYFRLHIGGRDLRSRSLWDAELPLPEVPVGETRRLYRTGPRDQPLLVRVAAFRKEGQPVRIAVAEDLSPLRADLRAFHWRYGVVSLVVAALLLGVQWALVALGMRPLRRVGGEIRRLEAGEQSRLSEDVPSEIRPLVGEVNRLVGVLGDRLERSRNALGNLAHALKTPLTRLFQAAEDPETIPDPDRRSRVLEPAEAIQGRIERELKRARLAAGAPGQRFRPDREIPALIRVLERTHADRGLEFAYHSPGDERSFGDREDLLELTGNLLDNAAKWARSRVRVTVSPAAGLVLTVEDDGPGVPPERAEELTQRGSRLDEAREGHGLGLAIVRDIVDTYRGDLRFHSSQELGGLAVTVSLPPPEAG